MKLTCEQKTEDMLEQILGINRECFSGVQRASDAEVTRMFRNHGVFVIIEDAKVLGFAICESLGSEVHLWSIAVREENRGHNLGGYLLDEARQYYRIYRCILCDVSYCSCR